MALHQRLQARLSQNLVLTPALQQAIKLLPMSTLELVNLLTQEVIDNPMLEEVSLEDAQPTEINDQSDRSDTQEPETESPASWEDTDFEYFFGEYLEDGYRNNLRQERSDLPPMEQTLSVPDSLADHLEWQLFLRSGARDEAEREIGLAIIGNLDQDGYLVASVEEIAAMGNWSLESVGIVLELVQSFDPIGVAARGLQECLLLQLQDLGLTNTVSETIVKEHLNLFETQESQKIARLLRLHKHELKSHIDIIRRLDPKPGSRYNPTSSQYVIPDVYVVKEEEGYLIKLNEDDMPQLRISPFYKKLLDKHQGHSDETREYARDKFRSALWLLKSVDQRQKTISKVATSIVTFQTEFLDHGIEFLRPLVLRDVAGDIGMHESTVSRVVNQKYMHTPQGVFEMKYFFHCGIDNTVGESISSIAVKQRIRKIIDGENRQHPLSDSRIGRALQAEGLNLARRTIAKYREELRIPTSSRRKVLF